MATIDRYYFSVCTRGLSRLGGDPKTLLREVGIEPALLTQPLWRGSIQSMAKLVRLVSKELKDESLGFTDHGIPSGSFAFAAELALAENSVAEGLRRAIDFYNLVNPDIHTRMEETSESVVLDITFRSPEKDPDHYFSEFWMIIWHRLACWLAGETLSILSADFDYARPVEYFEEFKYLFPCAHNFNTDRRRLNLDRHVLYAPVRRSIKENKIMISKAPLDIMTIPASDTSVHRKVRQLLVQRPSLTSESIAKQLNLRPDKLRRLLKSEGQSLSLIREFVRRDMATHWLVTSNFSVEKIAEDLGYAEARSFTRAFRKWTELSPSEYRRNVK